MLHQHENTGPPPETAVTASMRSSSSTQTVVPTARRISSAAARASAETTLLAKAPVTPLPTSAGVFGIVCTPDASNPSRDGYPPADARRDGQQQRLTIPNARAQAGSDRRHHLRFDCQYDHCRAIAGGHVVLETGDAELCAQVIAARGQRLGRANVCGRIAVVDQAANQLAAMLPPPINVMMPWSIALL